MEEVKIEPKDLHKQLEQFGYTKENFEEKPNAIALIPLLLEGGITLRVIIMCDDPNHHPMLMLKINEHTTKASILKAWENICEIRDSFFPFVRSEQDNNLEQINIISEMQKLDVGYGAIAKILNYRFLTLLFHAYKSNEDFAIPQKWGVGIAGMHFMLEAFGISDSIERYINEGFDVLETGKVPWPLVDDPIDIGKVRERIRYFRQQMKEKKVSLKPLPQPILEIVDFVLINDGSYEQLNQFIKQADPRFWKKNQDWILKRVELLKTNITLSEDPNILMLKQRLGMGKN